MNKTKWGYLVITRMFCVLVLLIGFCACESDQVDSAGVGMLQMSLSADTASVSKGINTTRTALADEFQDFLETADYKVAIVAGEDTIQRYDRFDAMPAQVSLKAGVYKLVAYKGVNSPAAFSSPYFEGSCTFTIKENMTTPIQLTCTLANARIMTTFTDDFKAAYDLYTVLLSSVYTSESFEIPQTDTIPVYMQVAEEGSELGIAIRLKKINETVEKTYTIPAPLSIERRQNIRLIFKTDGSSIDNIGLDVLLNDSLTNLTLNVGIPDFMWQQFKEPTLSPSDFKNDDTFTVKVGQFDANPAIGFAMPAGIGSLCIRRWEGDDDSRAEVIDLATETGKIKALDQNYGWSVNGLQNGNLKNERKTGQLFLKNAINSLESPLDEGEVYTYHYEFYGKDATGKAKETNVLRLKVIVQHAGNPVVTFDGFSESTIVEGDAQSKAIKAIFDGGALINGDKSTFTIHDGTTDHVYHIMQEKDANDLKTKWGISVIAENDVVVTLEFPADFSERLEAPIEGSRTYRYTCYLKNVNEKSYRTEKTLEVQAPVFALAMTDGDAFAKRIVLRAAMQTGHKDQLYFQYKPEDGSLDWQDVKSDLLTENNVDYTGLIKNLTATTNYLIRAIYQGAKKWESAPITLTTEAEKALINGDFEGSWNSRTISNMVNGANLLVSKVSLTSDDPFGWGTVNQKTFSGRRVTFDVLSTYNSVPSTMKIEGKNGSGVRLRTVGWDNGAGNTVTICYHAAAGKLFLGDYGFEHSNNQDNYNYGVSFDARPSFVKAHYKYDSCKNDSFKAWIVILNKDNGITTQIGYGEIESNKSVEDWSELKFPINYLDKEKKATHMYIVFSSSAYCSDNESEESNNLKNYIDLGGEVDGYTHHEGSNLYIDNVELIYE